MSAPVPPAAPSTQPTDAPASGPSVSMPSLSLGSFASGGWAILVLIISLLPAFFFCYGAAKLSFAKYGSYGWSILDFFFAGFYYPFYAWFLNTPPAPTGLLGGRRR